MGQNKLTLTWQDVHLNFHEKFIKSSQAISTVS
jgi:hypothetical protein